MVTQVKVEYEKEKNICKKRSVSNNDKSIKKKHLIPYLPTPPLGQDMTQGRFLSGV